ncbi:MAG: RIP metalloprotease RseP [Porphyrobacter sp.]|nr:RIP metalloprotease RseP [Porphyrobacter sp.]
MWIVGFLLVLGPLVTLHELGHYLVGRWFGVKADSFSVGFGSEIAGFTDRRGTRWKLASLPLGGYVQFAGDMNPASQPSDEWLNLPPAERARTFQAKPLWQRALIVAAGPLTNFAIAVLIIAGFAMAHGIPLGVPKVIEFSNPSDARLAGVEVGDVITKVDGHSIDNFNEIPQYVAIRGGQTISLTIDRDGRRIEVPVKLRRQILRDEFGNQSQIGDLGIGFSPAKIGAILAKSPAKKAGLETGDQIVSLNGTPIHGFFGLSTLIQDRPGQTVTIGVVRQGRPWLFPIRLDSVPAIDAKGRKVQIGQLGVGTAEDVASVGPFAAMAVGWQQSVITLKTEALGVWQILTGQRSTKELGGPLKIAKFSGEQLSLGWRSFVSFVALISINLAFINLLPIPALDGGHLAFYAAEAVRRKPASPRSQEWAFRTGIAFVLALMLFVTINDIVSLPIFGS